MTETVNCPVCSAEVPVEIEYLEGNPIAASCECGASLKVAYKVTRIDTDVSVETARFKCPECRTSIEVEDPNESGSEVFACESCCTRFKVEWSDWGYISNYEVLHENCPHCGQTLKYSLEIGYRMARLEHLLDHALYAATTLKLEDYPAFAIWETAASIDEDTWEAAALTARDQLFELIDSGFGPTITEKERDRYERKAIRWLKSKHPSGFS